ERFIEGPRHVEFQVFGDQHGNFVHLHERECSIQRRHQKILEESPSPFLDETLRKQMAEASLKAANAVQYLGAGTVEFIVGEDRSFYFIEMNTRLQVEHPVTEMRTGLDLVEWQIRVASGEKLPLDQDQIRPQGHSIEVRVCAENPERGFLPSSGLLELYDFPEDPSASGSSLIRLDSGFEQKDPVGIHYDSMLAKLIVHDEDRKKALETIQHALKQTAIIGPETNLGFLQKLVSHPQFLEGKADTLFIDACLPELLQNEETTPEWIYWACAIDFLQSEQESARQKAANSSNPHSPWHFYDNWRMGGEEPFQISFRDEENHQREVRLIERDSGFEVFSGKECIPLKFQQQGRDVVIRFENSNGTTEKHSLRIFRHQNDILAVHERGRIQLTLESGRDHEHETEHTDSQLKAPMPGNIIRVCVKNGEKVNRGQTLMVLEAMKMEHPILAPENGRVESLLFKEGDVVKTDEQMIEFEAE
ncbi:MAG: biotin/lipoyl-containing protein, partial [SAR324 cluster bacterium]|nr:biotin/lipoyl-containing protein [SAR324 cluster bacterium]